MKHAKQKYWVNEIEADSSYSANYWWWPKGVSGDEQNNVLSGDPNICEIIFGRGGDDIIYGGKSDILLGGDGNDVLVGSEGYNEFEPGSGFDTIVINDLGVTRADKITGFSASQDAIHLDGSKFTGLGKGALSADLFYIGAKGIPGDWHPGAEDRLLYDKTQWTLDYRAEDGTLVRIATLSHEWNSPDLSHLNFFIV